MAKSPPIYDLMLMLDSSGDDAARAKILADVEQSIAAGGGTVELKQAWGTRGLAYEIDHAGDAEYHLLQFSGPPALVEALSYNLKIDDGVVRHRIIKVTPGTPPAPEPAASEAAPPAEATAAEATVGEATVGEATAGEAEPPAAGEPAEAAASA
jgi:small subunit ribosomal protein S6